MSKIQELCEWDSKLDGVPSYSKSTPLASLGRIGDQKYRPRRDFTKFTWLSLGSNINH